MDRKIRFGVVGMDRGGGLIKDIYNSGAEVVALCDIRPGSMAQRKEEFPACKGAKEFSDFDEFIKEDMDAVLLANYFHEKAAYAIKVMRAGKHVLSETLSNVTMAEGVALVRAKEETGKTYALLENYPWLKENVEMERLYREGSLGNLVYAEGEYVHPMSAETQNFLAPGERHWRNWTPRTYYTTHALAPLMKMTDAIPTKVTAMAAFQPEVAKGTALRTGDAAAIILCQTDTNAVFRITGWAAFQPHGSYYRLCCTKGGVELNHTNHKLRLCYNGWGDTAFTEYDVPMPDMGMGKMAQGAGHGGTYFFVVNDFVKNLEEGREPYWNVYRATTAASVAILAWRSILNGNACYDVPDFRKEEDRRKYEFDNVSPYPDKNYRVHIPCSSQPYAPSEEDLRGAREYWKNKDYLER